MEKPIYCTECGKECVYKGVRTVSYKGKTYYDQNTGKPMKEESWSCPENDKWWSGVHSNYTSSYREE